MKFLLLILALVMPGAAIADCVILLHGLARTKASFFVIQEVLQADGYRVVRPSYPSTKERIKTLADEALPEAVQACGDQPVHFVTQCL